MNTARLVQHDELEFHDQSGAARGLRAAKPSPEFGLHEEDLPAEKHARLDVELAAPRAACMPLFLPQQLVQLLGGVHLPNLRSVRRLDHRPGLEVADNAALGQPAQSEDWLLARLLDLITAVVADGCVDLR
eukprot:6211826-Pleurochrysis_carterae.AAC.2